MGSDGVFVLVVDLDFEEFLDLFRRPHFDRIPRHSFTNVNADLAADALIEPDLNIRDNDVDTVRGVARRVFDAIDGAEADTSFTTRAVIGYDDGEFLGLLLFPRNLRGSFGND